MDKEKLSLYKWLVESFKAGSLFKFPKSKAVKSAEEMQKRDLRRNLVSDSTKGYIKKARIPNRIKSAANGTKFNEFVPIDLPKVEQSWSDVLHISKPILIEQAKDSWMKNYETLDAILLEVTPKVPTNTVNYSTLSLEELAEREHLPIKITSSKRPGSMTRSGHRSYHSQTDLNGHSKAYDIVPMFDGKIDNSDAGFAKLTDVLMTNPNVRNWFETHGFGILDETSLAMMKRTGATGKHFHIGPDKIALKGYNDLLSKYSLT